MLSLWPAGNPSNSQGTIDWAGGVISWSSPYMTNGYYYARVMDVEVECYGPGAGANVTGASSYIYNTYDGLNTSVAVTDDGHVLSSFYATGENEAFDPFASTSTSSTTAATSSATNTQSTSSTTTVALATASVNTVPGAVGGGVHGDSGNSGSGTASAAGAASSAPGSYGGFSQGLAVTNGAAPGKEDGVLRESVVAMVVGAGVLLFAL